MTADLPDIVGDVPAGTRDRLLSAALEAFARHGFDGASVRLVERLAGVERGLVAYHFGTKEALWTEVVDSMWSGFTDEVNTLLTHLRDVSRNDRATAILKAYVRFSAAHPQFFRILVAEGYQRTSRAEHLAEHLRAGIQLWRTALMVADTDERADDAEEAALVFQVMSAASGAFAMAAYGDPVFGVDPMDPTFIERFASLLAERRWV